MTKGKRRRVGPRWVLTPLLFACPLTPSALGAGTDSGYVVQARWPIGGEGKWDYLTVDGTGQRLFLSRATRVQVLDLASGALLGEIANTQGVHGIALAPDLKRGFTSNGASNSVTVFDLVSLAPITEIKVSGQKPDAIVYDPPSRRVYTFNGHSNSASVIDAASAKEVATIALPGAPEFAVSDGRGHIFVNLEDKGALAVIDVAKGIVQATWPLAPCQEPTGLALDPAHHRLFSVCHNQHLVVTDSESGKRIADLPIGAHVDAAAYDPGTSLVFSSNGGSADVTVVSQVTPDQYSVRGSLATAPGAKTMALDTKTHRLYIPAQTDAGFQVLVAGPK